MVGSAHRRLLDFFEALVQTQVVTDRILPSRRRRLEVWEMLTEKKKYKSYKGAFNEKAGIISRYEALSPINHKDSNLSHYSCFSKIFKIIL